MENRLRIVHMGKAKCALDLGDGSERAEYVNQDYILQKLGRPHRNINIMYTYYPYDKEWPQRSSIAWKDMEITSQWDYPYDDYFPYLGGTGVATEKEPFACMRDIRKHGQDVTLTLTIDCSVEEETLRNIARELKPFGRMRIRINHECAGSWFAHNKRYTYQEVADFFVKFHEIIKEEAPNVSTIFCGGAVKENEEELEYEKEFTKAYQTADFWSGDCYLALHYGWPLDVCEKDGNTYVTYSVDKYYENIKCSVDRMAFVNQKEYKPFVISEFNTDGDVTGPLRQGESILKFAKKLKQEDESWFNSFSMYQFRDRGRLGLEIEDPNNSSVGIEQPIMKAYKEILNDPYFMPEMEAGDFVELPAKVCWGSAEEAEGLSLSIPFEKTPEFCEITFEEPLNVMMEFNGKWFYKAPETNTIDLMSAFFDRPLSEKSSLTLKMFFPPATGENEPSQGEDWAENYYCTISKMPKLRIRYESIADIE